MRPSVRVRDLTGAADALTFTAPSRIDSSDLPLPCRAARLTADPRVRGAIGDLPGVSRLDLGTDIILAGTSRALSDAASRLPDPLGSQLSLALERYDAPTALLRFPRDRSWNLAERTHVLGVLNVTPDSFSDGGRFVEPDAAVRRAEVMLDEGADGIDIGGESTRPGADKVSPGDEARRVIPVVARLRRSFPESVLSVDTRSAHVARLALDAGACMVNDISGLEDPGMAALVAEAGCALAVMHLRGTPQTMQNDTRYSDLVGEVMDGLGASLAMARSSGVPGDRILVDPGIGFGKSATGNELLLRQLDSFRTLGKPILVGVSRKSFIGRRTGVTRADDRLAGSLAAATAAVFAGASVIRAHDIGPTRRALAVADAISRAGTTARDGELRP